MTDTEPPDSVDDPEAWTDAVFAGFGQQCARRIGSDNV